MVKRAGKLFIEGGGDSNDLQAECRNTFRNLLEKAGLKGRLPRIIAAGPREGAYRDFCSFFSDGTVRAFLLVDSEGPVSATSPWEHLKQRDKWEKPPRATDDQCHLMVQCMETWFLADPPALQTFFGQGFAPKSLPAHANIEDAPKTEVLAGLEAATAQTKTKGEYDKGAHSFKVLGTLDPAKVRQRSKWAERFFATMERVLE